MSGASFPGTHKVMLFIDGHYLAKNISEKTDGEDKIYLRERQRKKQ